MKNILKESIRLSSGSLIQAVKVYKYVLSQRKDIVRENEGKCGIFR